MITPFTFYHWALGEVNLDNWQCMPVSVRVFTDLFVLLGDGLHFELEFLVTVVESLDLLLHLPLLVLRVGHLEEGLHLGEQSPPLPVAQLQVALDVALDDADGSELLHTLLVGPEKKLGGRREEAKEEKGETIS